MRQAGGVAMLCWSDAPTIHITFTRKLKVRVSESDTYINYVRVDDPPERRPISHYRYTVTRTSPAWTKSGPAAYKQLIIFMESKYSSMQIYPIQACKYRVYTCTYMMWYAMRMHRTRYTQIYCRLHCMPCRQVISSEWNALSKWSILPLPAITTSPSLSQIKNP